MWGKAEEQPGALRSSQREQLEMEVGLRTWEGPGRPALGPKLRSSRSLIGLPVGRAAGARGRCRKRGSGSQWGDLGTGRKGHSPPLLTAASPGSFRADGADLGPSKLPGAALLEDPPQRLRWQAHLEFTHNHDVGDLTWDKIAVSLPRSEKLRSLVLAGIPHSMRPQVKQGGTR